LNEQPVGVCTFFFFPFNECHTVTSEFHKVTVQRKVITYSNHPHCSDYYKYLPFWVSSIISSASNVKL